MSGNWKKSRIEEELHSKRDYLFIKHVKLLLLLYLWEISNYQSTAICHSKPGSEQNEKNPRPDSYRASASGAAHYLIAAVQAWILVGRRTSRKALVETSSTVKKYVNTSHPNEE